MGLVHPGCHQPRLSNNTVRVYTGLTEVEAFHVIAHLTTTLKVWVAALFTPPIVSLGSVGVRLPGVVLDAGLGPFQW